MITGSTRVQNLTIILASIVAAASPTPPGDVDLRLDVGVADEHLVCFTSRSRDLQRLEGDRNKTSTGPYRSCAAHLAISNPLILILVW